MIRVLQGGAVVLLSVGLTVFMLDASETWQGREGTLLGQIFSHSGQHCPDGMVSLAGYSFRCADKFEAAPSQACPHHDVTSVAASGENLQTNTCTVISEPNALPWRFVSREEARLLCARVGKRLPTATEWYQLALGTAAELDACHLTQSTVSKTGSARGCSSAIGVYDAVGNVWEWVADDVVNQSWQRRSLPESGYVQSVDQAGVVVVASSSPNVQYQNDYFWSPSETVQAMMRGGFYGSGEDGGVYAVHTGIVAETRGQAIGFRCVL